MDIAHFNSINSMYSIYYFTIISKYVQEKLNDLNLNVQANKNDKDKYQEKVSFILKNGQRMG